MTREGEEKAMICFNFEAFIIIGSNDKNFWSEVATFEQFLANKQIINDPRFCRESLHFTLQNILRTDYPARVRSARARRACALRALGLLLADGTPTVGGGKTFWAVSRIFLRKQL